MEWKDRVKNRFSKTVVADIWVDIYTTETPNVDAVSFRKRRDYTIAYVTENIPTGSFIMDLGCGAGPVLSELVKYDYRLLGLDFSFDMLLRTRKTLGTSADAVPLAVADCEHIPVSDSSLDCIVCLGVISYAESIDAALREQHRILKPGGKTIISYRNNLNSILLDPAKLIKYMISIVFKNRKSEYDRIGLRLSRREILKIIKNLPFAIVKEHQIGFGSIRMNEKILSNGRLAIKINKLLHKFLGFFKLTSVYRAISDIHIVILEKPA